MGLKNIRAVSAILASSTTTLYLSIVDASQIPSTGETPDIYIRRLSDGFFFDGAAFVDTSDVPTALAMTETGATIVPGLYYYSLVDPGLIQPLAEDEYQLRYVNVGGTVNGTDLDAMLVKLSLRDINTQGT